MLLGLHNKTGVNSARHDILHSLNRLANHLKTLYWFYLGFGPFLGNFFGGSLPVQFDPENPAALMPGSVSEAVDRALLVEGMQPLPQGAAQVRINVFFKCEPQGYGENSLGSRQNGPELEKVPAEYRAEVDLGGRGLHPDLLQAFAGSAGRAAWRHRWCAALRLSLWLFTAADRCAPAGKIVNLQLPAASTRSLSRCGQSSCHRASRSGWRKTPCLSTCGSLRSESLTFWQSCPTTTIGASAQSC